MAQSNTNNPLKPTMVDITKYGPMGYRMLQSVNNGDDLEGFDEDEKLRIQGNRAMREHMGDFSLGSFEPDYYKSPYAESSTPYGQSKYDESWMSADDLEHIQDIRSNNQSGFMQFINGVIKMPITVGTTFVNGVGGLANWSVDVLANLVGLRNNIDENIYNYAHEIARMETIEKAKTSGEPIPDASKFPDPTNWQYIQAAWRAGIQEMWDSPVTESMNAMSQWAENTFPNYRTEYEQQHPLNLLDHPANFAGDLVKMVGFTVGAFYSGKVLTTAMGIQGGKVASVIAGSVLGALGESSMEAINNTDDWKKEEIQKYINEISTQANTVQNTRAFELAEAEKWKDNALLNPEVPAESVMQAYNERVNEINNNANTELNKLSSLYKGIESQIDTQSGNMGNVIFGLNLAILTISNMLFLGRLFKGSMNSTMRGLLGMETVGLSREGTYYAHKPFLGIAGQYIKNFASEGGEEMAQYIAATASGDYYGIDVNNFYRSQVDPDAVWTENHALAALWQGTVESVKDEQFWTEGLSGGLMGLTGFGYVGRKTNPATGKSSLTFEWEGAPWTRWSDYKKEMAGRERDAAYMNQRAEEWNRKFGNRRKANAQGAFYEELQRQATSLGGRRHGYGKGESSDLEVTEGENTGAEEKTGIPDAFNYKTAQHASIVADVLAWSRAGRLDEYMGWLKTAYNTSDENLRNIVKFTSSQNEDGSWTGPFIDKWGNGYDVISDESKKDMIETLTKARDKTINSINRIQNIRNWIQSSIHENISEDDMDELVYMQSQIEDFRDRIEQIGGEIRPALEAVRDKMREKIESLGEWIVSAKKNERNLPEDLRKLQQLEEQKAEGTSAFYQAIYNLVDDLLHMDNKKMGKTLAHRADRVYQDTGIRVLKNAVNALDSSEIDDEKKADTVQKIQDILVLNMGEDAFRDKLSKYIKDPSEQRRDHRKIINDLFNKKVKEKTDKLKKSLENVSDVNEVESILNQEPDENIRKQALNDLEKDPVMGQLVKDYRERKSYKNDIIKAIQEADEDGQIKDDALKMLDWIMKNTQTVDRMASVLPTGVIDDWNAADLVRAMGASDEQISNNDLDAEYARYDEAKYLLGNIMNQINQKYKEAGIVSQTIPQYIHQEGDAVAGTNQTNNESTSADPSGVVPAVNEGGTVTTKTTSNSGAIGDVTSEQVAEDNESVESSTEGNNTDEASESYWKPAVPQMQEDKMRVREFEEFVATRGEGFRLIYEELKNRGAFDYINSGQLKPGDKVYFMISPDFESRKQKDSTYGGDKSTHTIFIVKKNADGTIQVLGDLNEGSSAERFTGLPEFRKAVIQQYTKAQLNPETKGKEFVTDDDLSTTIQKVMNGRIEYAKEGTSEKSLAQTPNIRGKNGDTQPKFGVMKNNTIQAKDIDAGQIEQLQDSVGKEGRLYLLVPNTRGGYSPVAVRVLHFDNTSLFNLPQEGGFYIDNDGNIDWSKIDNAFNTPVGRPLLQALVRMAQARDAEAIDAAFKPLKDYLYFGDVGVHFSPNGIVVKTGTDDSTTRVVDWYRKESDENGNPVEHPLIVVVRNLVQELQAHGVKLQIDYNKLNSTEVDGNGKTYNDNLIDSNLITSNLQAAEMVSGWFTMNIQLKGADGKFETVRAKSPVYSPTSRPTTASTAHVDSVQGIAVKSNNTGETYYVDLETGTIRTADGKKAKFSEANTKLILALAWANETYGDRTEDLNMVNNHVLLSDDTILNRTTQTLMFPGEDEYDLWKQYIEDANNGKVNTDNRLTVGTEIMANPTGRYEKMAITEVRDDGYLAEFNGVQYFISEENAQKGKKMIGGQQIQTQAQTQTQSQQQAQNQNEKNNPQTLTPTNINGRFGAVVLTAEPYFGDGPLYKDAEEGRFETHIDASKGEALFQPINLNILKSFEYMRDVVDIDFNGTTLSEATLMTVTKPGKAVLKDGKWAITEKPQVTIEGPSSNRNKGATAIVEQQQQQEAESTAKATSIIGGNLDIFNTEHVSKVSEENRDHSIETIDGNSKLGVYELEGKLYSGQLSPLTTVTIDGVSYPIHATKTRKDEEGECDVIVVMPNGYARKMGTYPDGLVNQRLDAIRKKIEEPSSNTRTLEQSTQKTQLFDPATQTVGVPMSTPVESGTNNTSNASATLSDAAYGNTKSVKRKLPGQKKQQTEENPSQGESSDMQVEENPLENPPELNKEYDVSELERLFNGLLNLDADAQNLGVLANKVFDVARNLGLKVKFVPFIPNKTPGKRTVGRFVQGGTILIDLPYFLTQADEKSAQILLHETIHAVVNYALSDQMKSALNKSSNAHLREAVKEIKRVYSILKNTELGREYGFTDVKEMMAELSNYKFREKLKKVGVRENLWQRLKNAIIRIFTGKMKPHTNAYETISGLLDMTLEHFDRGLYNEYNRVEDNPEAREMSDIAIRDINKDNLMLRSVASSDEVKAKFNNFKTVNDLENFLLDATDEYVRRLKADKLVIPIERTRNEVRQVAATNPDQLLTIMYQYGINVQDKYTGNKIDESKFTDEDIDKIRIPLQEKLNEDKQNVIKEWIDAVADYDIAIGYVVMRDLYKFVYGKGNNLKNPQAFVRNTFESVVTRIEESTKQRQEVGKSPLSFNFYREYNNETWNSVITDPAIRTVKSNPVGGISGTWIRFAPKSEITDGIEGTTAEDRMKNMIGGLNKVSRGTEWCTQYEGANHVLEADDHAFWAFVPEGYTSATMAIVPIKEGQEKLLKDNPWYVGIFKVENGSDNMVDPNMFENVNDLLRNSGDKDIVRTLDALGYSGMSREELEKLKKQKVKAQIDYVNNHEGLYTADDIEDLQNIIGISLTQTEDGLSLHEFTSGIYEQIPEEVRDKFWQDIFNSIDIIEEECSTNISADHMGIKSLGNVKFIGGGLMIESLEDLGKLETVGQTCWITKNIHSSKVISIDTPKLVVYDNYNNLDILLDLNTTHLDISGSKIRSLDGEFASLKEVTIRDSELLKHKSIRITEYFLIDNRNSGYMTSLEGYDYTNATVSINGNVSNLGNTTEVDTLSIDNMTEPADHRIGNISIINGGLYLRNTSIRDLNVLGPIQEVGANVFSINGYHGVTYSPLESLGSLKRVEGKSEYKGAWHGQSIWKMKDFPSLSSLGNLEQFMGDLVLDSFTLTDLGNLKTVDNLTVLTGISPELKTFGSIETITGSLSIDSAHAIRPFNKPVTIGKHVRISCMGISKLSDIAKLGQVEIFGDLDIQDVPNNLYNLESIIDMQKTLEGKIKPHGLIFINGKVIGNLINPEAPMEKGQWESFDWKDYSNRHNLKSEEHRKEYSDYEVPMNTNVSSYEELDSETRTALQEKGWTEEKWNKAPQEVRDYAQQCVGF